MSKDIREIPEEIYLKNYKLHLCIDIVYINGMTFLVSIDREIRFRLIVHLKKRAKSLLYEGLDKIIRVYNNAGFRIKVILADNEFRPLLEDVEDNMGIQFNYTNAEEHETYIERNNRTIEERCRTAYHDLPYNNVPKILIKHMAIDQVRKCNFYPAKGGVSSYYSPRMIIKQTNIDYDKHCKYGFGSYVQAFEDNDPNINSMKPRTIDAIYLGSMENYQGGHLVVNINIWKPIK